MKLEGWLSFRFKNGCGDYQNFTAESCHSGEINIAEQTNIQELRYVLLPLLQIWNSAETAISNLLLGRNSSNELIYGYSNQVINPVEMVIRAPRGSLS